MAFDNYGLAQKFLTFVGGKEMGKKICIKIYLLAFKNNNIL